MFKQLFGLAAILVSFCASAGAEERSAFGFEFTSIDGKPLPLKQFEGRVLLVVNTASFCGYTPQYQGLEELYSRYQTQGLTVIGVPANDFGQQEPKKEAEIKKFCQGAFGVTFPLTSKQVVVGDGAHPFYRWAATTLGKENVPAWNFHKYLVARGGHLIGSFRSEVTPDSTELRGAIERALSDKMTAAK
ncbi:glutathione peroxidase [Hyphomicrobium sp.]|uniref:glutathione peroxidase n=1 Tax=Hyphomicrobium sp. TaxID=82 RepID=UPI000FB85C5E|nr:glutathione peroxidase [Hyphomicrobium sp.]RUP00720.1 MAG: glutathione peroxidase [Hyphomicrobium sp.]